MTPSATIYNRQRPPHAPAPKPAPGHPAPKPEIDLDPYLNRMRVRQLAVDLHLMSGEVLAGAVVNAVRRYDLDATVEGREICVMKHALGWIAPSK